MLTIKSEIKEQKLDGTYNVKFFLSIFLKGVVGYAENWTWKTWRTFFEDTPFYREYSEKVLINSMIIAYFTIFAL